MEKQEEEDEQRGADGEEPLAPLPSPPRTSATTTQPTDEQENMPSPPPASQSEEPRPSSPPRIRKQVTLHDDEVGGNGDTPLAPAQQEEVQDIGPLPKFSLPPPPPSRLHSRRSSRRGSSGSLASIEDILGLTYKPPEPPDESKWWFTSKWMPRYDLVEKLVPQEVKEVELRYKRSAYSLYIFALTCFIAYSLALVVIMAEKRKNPPTRVTAITGKSWPLPNMAVCLDSLKGFDIALQSGYIKGYHHLDRHPIRMDSLATVLDSSCNNTADMACFWLDYSRYAPIDITAAVSDKQMIMDIIYSPIIRRENEAKIWPVHQAAFISFTDLPVDKWCTADPKVAMRSRYAVPTSFLQEDTFRTYNFLTKVTRQKFHASTHSLAGYTTPPDVYYGLRSQYTPVTGATKMLSNFSWYIPCNYNNKHGCQDVDERDNRLDHFKERTDTEAILLTFIQDDSVTEYAEVDPFNALEMFGSIGGFWTYVLGAFTLIFVTRESGKRTLHFAFRSRTWRRWWSGLAYKLRVLMYKCRRCFKEDELRSPPRKRHRRRRSHRRTSSTSGLLEGALSGGGGDQEGKEGTSDAKVIDIAPSPVRPPTRKGGIASMADVALQAMRGRKRVESGTSFPSSNEMEEDRGLGDADDEGGALPGQEEEEEEEDSGEDLGKEEDDDEEDISLSEEEEELEVQLEKRVEMLEKVLKHILKAPLILDEEKVKTMALTWRERARQGSNASPSTSASTRMSPGGIESLGPVDRSGSNRSAMSAISSPSR